MKLRSSCLVMALAFLIPQLTATDAAEWFVPLGGNAFHTSPAPGGQGFQRDGAIKWSQPNSVYSAYFHVDRQADLLLKLGANGSAGKSSIRVTVGGSSFNVAIHGQEKQIYEIGKVSAPVGYVRVDFQGIDRTADFYAGIRTLIVESATEGLKIDYVKSDKGNMFYWGRRGPSVHLRYSVPNGKQIKHAYSELTIPVGQDPVGSYFMANGFGEGYFGIQVNGPKERRVLFSVWSPFKTDNPSDIPKDQRIEALARGPDVHIGKFGNEGSGGQSRLVYPWVAGKTYRFLTEVEPDGNGSTIYTSWFGDKAANEWRLIASFRRPKTETHLRGFHSFLENFAPSHGHIQRRVDLGNIWVRDQQQQWHECTQARFSVDATGAGRHRLDFAGGSDGENFFMRNCGFFRGTVSPGSSFTRKSTLGKPPKIDFDELQRK